MAADQPPELPGTPPPGRPNSPGGLGKPLLLNLAAMLLLGLLAQALAGSDYRGQRAVADTFFVFLLGLLAVDGLACLVLLFVRPRWAAGFALAALLVALVGLGTCGYSLSHMHPN